MKKSTNPQNLSCQVCIVGGGPAGIMLGFLLARSGAETIVLEKHKDFFRDFRGDTIHPSTMQILDELGLLQKFLILPHAKSHKLAGFVNGEKIDIADFSHLNVKSPYIAFVPQWDFLNFLSKEAVKHKSFSLMMETKGEDILEEEGKVKGVVASKNNTRFKITADVVIAADGRDSTLRKKAQFNVISEKVPIDLLWFRIPRKKSQPSYSLGHVKTGNFLVMIERDTYWQCGYVIKKGTFESIKKKGIKEFDEKLQNLLSEDKSLLENMTWNDIKLLSVTVDHLEKWYKDGLLCIGDAAHAMSPVGGVGINLAIQDAVAAARIITGDIERGELSQTTLKKVQKRRQLPTRVTQKLQLFLHARVVFPVLNAKDIQKAALPFRLLKRFPVLRRIPARIIGLGVRTEHV